MKKVLIVTTVESTVRAFLLPYMKWFRECGMEVHVACAVSDDEGKEPLPYCDKQFALSFSRSPLDISNRTGYRQLKEIIEREGYALVHCHTPVASVYCRLAAREARKKGTKVVYTAHGFHFFKGASRKNWLLFYPVEKWLARYTDCLITINEEDYQAARRAGFRAGRIEKVCGVGVDLSRFGPVTEEEKQRLRRDKEIPEQDFVLFYAAELSPRKNHQALLAVMDKIKTEIPSLKVLLAGKGPLKEELEKTAAEKGLSGQLHFLGFRTDIKELVQLSDLLVSTSRQEGLPVNIMEGMACGKPIVASHVRGNRDLIEDGVNGYTFQLGDTEKAARCILELYRDSRKCSLLAGNALEMVKACSLEKALKEHGRIYRELLE